jgi:hypothetical protein
VAEQQIYLRIPGAAEYWHELDIRVSSGVDMRNDTLFTFRFGV